MWQQRSGVLRRGTFALAVVSMLVLTVAAACSGSNSGDDKETLVFSDLNWTSAQIQNRIAQYIVEIGYGYPTDVVLGATLPLFQGLRRGDTHITMEIWLPNQEEAWAEALAAGEVVELARAWAPTGSPRLSSPPTCRRSTRISTTSTTSRTTSSRRCSPPPRPAARRGWCPA